MKADRVTKLLLAANALLLAMIAFTPPSKAQAADAAAAPFKDALLVAGNFDHFVLLDTHTGDLWHYAISGGAPARYGKIETFGH